MGYDPQFGARPLERAIQSYVQDGLARMVLAGPFTSGDTVAVDRGGDILVFRKAAANVAAA